MNRRNVLGPFSIFVAPNPYADADEFAAVRGELAQVASLCDDPARADFVFVYGGDGSMLAAIRQYGSASVRRFVGVNGGTLGFLLNERGSERLVAGPIEFHELWLLEAQLSDAAGERTLYGFNDIRIERATEQVIKVRMWVDGREVPGLITGDGIIGVTPQGSTGYNHSAHGRVIMPGVPVLQITPVACKVNKVPLGSVILSDRAEVVLRIEEQQKRPVRLLVDNTPPGVTAPIQELRLRRSARTIELGFFHPDAFLARIFSVQYPA